MKLVINDFIYRPTSPSVIDIIVNNRSYDTEIDQENKRQ
jgi:hypothetical protein